MAAPDSQTPRIAVVSPNRDAWSETFIAAHIQRLADVGLTLTDGHLPRRMGDGSLLLQPSLADRVWNKISGATVDELLRKRITSLLRAHRIQIVLAEYGPTGEAMLDVCRRLDLPLVVHFHGVDAWHMKLWEENARYARIFKEAAAIIAVSREMEAHLLARGAPRERLHYICYGIDIERFGRADGGQAPPHLLAVGRFADTKAPHLTLTAFHLAWSQEPSLRMTMAGQGPLMESCLQLRAALGLEKVVGMPGVLAHEQVGELMRASRAFVQHSVTTSQDDREGTPLAVLESLASGLPVVATRHAGIGEVVEHDVSGLLCEERDVRGMAANMLAIARDPAMATRMGLAGRARVERDHRIGDRIGDLQRVLMKAAVR